MPGRVRAAARTARKAQRPVSLEPAVSHGDQRVLEPDSRRRAAALARRRGTARRAGAAATIGRSPRGGHHVATAGAGACVSARRGAHRRRDRTTLELAAGPGRRRRCDQRPRAVPDDLSPDAERQRDAGRRGVAHAGDLLRVGYVSAGSATASSSRSTAAASSRFTCRRPAASRPACGRRGVLLDQAYELDDAPAWEGFYFVTATQPFAVETIRDAARRAGGTTGARRRSVAAAGRFHPGALLDPERGQAVMNSMLLASHCSRCCRSARPPNHASSDSR